MLAAEIISSSLVPVRNKQRVSVVLARMEEAHISDLPVVESGRLLGMVKEATLLEAADPGAAVQPFVDTTEVPFVRGDQHLYAAVRVIDQRQLTVVPVVDGEGRYLGAITRHGAFRRLVDQLNIVEPGSTVVLEMNQNDYVLEQIARIVEGNDAKVMSVTCHVPADSVRMEVTLRINREDVRGIIQTFERFDYTVKRYFHGARVDDGMKGRFEELMRIIGQ